MKILKYNLCTRKTVFHFDPVLGKYFEQIEEVLSPVEMGWNEANEEIAKKEAYKGEYTIEDDGQPEPEPTPSGGDSAVWDELDEAYQKGVDSV